MAVLKEIPNEVLLEIISHFTLKSLITASGVSRAWRHFVTIADIHPVRRGLLDLYRRVVTAPWFLRGRPWVLKNLRPFDREAYIHTLSQYRCRIPEEFSLWILEWPARAAFRSKWPGLPDTEVKNRFNPAARDAGINNLGTLPPTVYSITYTDFVMDETTGEKRAVNTEIPGLAICEETFDSKTWLLLDESDAFHGKVLWTIDPIAFEKYDDDEDCNLEYYISSSWLKYLEEQKVTVDLLYARMPANYVTPPPSPPGWPIESLPTTISTEWPKITDS